MFECIFVPYNLAFAQDKKEEWEEIFSNIVTGMFLFDIVLNFNTGFYNKGKLVLSRKSIALNYLKFWFWMDLLASFPYEIVMNEIMGDSSQEEAGQSSMY